jgi:hypothetical protein
MRRIEPDEDQRRSRPGAGYVEPNDGTQERVKRCVDWDDGRQRIKRCVDWDDGRQGIRRSVVRDDGRQRVKRCNRGFRIKRGFRD